MPPRQAEGPCRVLTALPVLQDYMQNVHGKEIDLLRTTVKVPGKRLPRATTATAPSASPKTNGLAKERSSTQFPGNTGKTSGHGHGGHPCSPCTLAAPCLAMRAADTMHEGPGAPCLTARRVLCRGG